MQGTLTTHEPNARPPRSPPPGAQPRPRLQHAREERRIFHVQAARPPSLRGAADVVHDKGTPQQPPTTQTARDNSDTTASVSDSPPCRACRGTRIALLLQTPTHARVRPWHLCRHVQPPKPPDTLRRGRRLRGKYIAPFGYLLAAK